MSAEPIPIRRGTRLYDIRRQRPSSVFFGRVQNPDDNLAKFGTADGLALYATMRKQNAYLSGLVERRIDNAASIERQIIAGDTNSQVSQDMARDLRRWWARLPQKDTLCRELLGGFFTGIAPAEVVWPDDGSRDPYSNLLAPIAINGIPPEAMVYGPNNEEYFRTDFAPQGIPVEPGRIVTFRWGSTWTQYGKGEGRDCYMPYWYIQTCLEFGLQAVEEFGRPMPIGYYPSTWGQQKIDDFEASISADHEIYMLVPWDEPKPEVKLLSENIATQGGAARSEFAFIQQMERWLDVRLTGSQQAGASGARAGVEALSGITDNKTPAMSDTLDETLTLGVADAISYRNWPQQPRQLWPRFQSDTTEISEDRLNGIQAETAERQILRVIANQIPSDVAIEIITGVGIPRTRAERMVTSAIKERPKLNLDPEITGQVGAQPAPEPVQGAAQ